MEICGLKEAVEIMEGYDTWDTNKKKAMQTILAVCQSVLECKGMPLKLDGPDNYSQVWNTCHAEWVKWIASRVNKENIEKVIDMWDIENKLDEIDKKDIAAAIVAELKEGK